MPDERPRPAPDRPGPIEAESPALVGRADEQAQIAALLQSVRQGISGVLVVQGGAGVGKTTLLTGVVTAASDFAIIRFDAVQSEMHLGYSALHALLAPFLDDINSLPGPQARALHAAFGVVDDTPPDTFVAGLATLTLLSGAAAARPLLIIVDDAQWVDQESANVIAFVARRLYADHVAMLIGVRESRDVSTPFDDLPRLDVDPLSEEASRAVLELATPDVLGAAVADRIIAEAAGNPLALVVMAAELSRDQTVGVAALPQPFRIDHRLEARFLLQVRDLPEDSQRFLLAVAAEPTGDLALILRAGKDLEFDGGSIDAAVGADLVTIEPTVRFRHPLIRSAVHQGANDTTRRRTHAALADATDVERDPDRRAWHRATAASLPDEDVAAELDAAASRAQAHGSHPSAAALYERSAELTPDRDQRAIRLLLAAAATFTAGNSERAYRTVTRSIADLDDPIIAQQARRLQAAALLFEHTLAPLDNRTAERPHEIMTTMLDAVLTLAPLDIHLARETMLDTIQMAMLFEGLHTPTVQTAAEVALSLRLPPGTEPTTTDLMLDAFATLTVHGYAAAAEVLHQSMHALRAGPLEPGQLGTTWLGFWIAMALGDEKTARFCAAQLADVSRERGDFRYLPEALNYLGICEMRVGDLAAASAHYSEQQNLTALSGGQIMPDVSLLMTAAWRGEVAEVRSTAAELSKQATDMSLGLLCRWIDYALMIVELGLGDYTAAAQRTPRGVVPDVGFDPFAAADQIEAHVRIGDPDGAIGSLEYLTRRAEVTTSPLDLGLLARGRALLADDTDAERWFHESAAQLSSSGATLHLARTQLVYGEWLRRQQRRRDARTQLEQAHDIFDAAGAIRFAARADAELRATGAASRKRIDETRNDLTPQEEQIARLAAGGATNSEIASRLFVSPNTVDYHLRKVFRKLNITSRRQLVETMADPG